MRKRTMEQAAARDRGRSVETSPAGKAAGEGGERSRGGGGDWGEEEREERDTRFEERKKHREVKAVPQGSGDHIHYARIEKQETKRETNYPVPPRQATNKRSNIHASNR